MKLTDEEIKAIKTLVGRIDVEEVSKNPRVFDDRIEAAVNKVLTHYGKRLGVQSLYWDAQRGLQAEISLMDLPETAKKEST